MIESLNTNNLSVDETGRVTFSGLSSGIDAVGTVDKIMAARRIPVDSLETRISGNELKITALKQLKAALNGVRDSLANLFGSPSFGATKDIFEAKLGFATTSRVDGATPAAAGNLLGVSVTNSAAIGSHDIEILRTATAHKVSSDAQASTITSLGFAADDTFTINDPDGAPVTITVNAGTTLGGLRDAINSANNGTNATGVTASIVSVSTTEHYLLLTKDATGTAMTLADTTGTPLASVGILTGGAMKNELKAAQTAQIYVDGVLDQTDKIYESNHQTASTALVGSTGQLNFSGYGTVNYTAADTLATLATNITAVHADVTATIVTDGDGVRLEITSVAATTITESGAGAAINDLGIDNKRKVVERDTNTISDLFTGVTLNVFQAEAGTNIKIDIDKDLNKIKAEIAAFVDAYNTLKTFLNGQRQNRTDSTEDTDLTGVLISSNVLEQVENDVGRILNTAVAGITGSFTTLPQTALTATITTGISYVTDLADPLAAGTLSIDEAKLDEALLNKSAEFEELFTFAFTSADSRVSLLAFNGNTTHNTTGYTLNIQPASGDNLALFSDQLDNAFWMTERASVSADGLLAPDGTTSADGLIGDGVSNTHYVHNAPSTMPVVAGQSYNFSVYAKQGDNDSARIAIGASNFPTGITADFNLNTGTIIGTGYGVEDASITDVGNGWYRISIKATATGSGNSTVEMYSRTAASLGYSGDGATVNTYFWGAQLDPVATDSTIYNETGLSTIEAVVNPNIVAPLAPDGTATAESLVSSAVFGGHTVYNTTGISVTSGQQYEYTTFVQQGARDRVRLFMDDAATFPVNTFADFDINTGTVLATGAGADSAAIEDVGGGWFKVTVTGTATATGATGKFEMFSADSINGVAFSGDGATVDTYFWDQRVVPVTTLGAYVPTTTAAVTGLAASANIDGVATGIDDGSATVTGNTIVVNTGGAQGLRLFYDGFSLSSTIQLDFTIGIGALLFSKIDQLVQDTTGPDGNKLKGALTAEIDTLTDQNEVSRDRIERMLGRLEIQRQSLLDRFIAMEIALAHASRIRESLSQTTAALLKSRN